MKAAALVLAVLLAGCDAVSGTAAAWAVKVCRDKGHDLERVSVAGSGSLVFARCADGTLIRRGE